MIFASKKTKTTKNILEKRDLAIDIPIVDIPSYSCFSHIITFITGKAIS